MIYLDHHATTPLDPRVREAMMHWYENGVGNPASFHAFGKQASGEVEAARGQAALLIGGDPRGMILTSGATESIHLALQGLCRFVGLETSPGIVTCVTEHPAVLETCAALEAAGAGVHRLGVDATGRIDLDELDAALAPADGVTKPLVCSIMAVNNEIGTAQDLAEIGARCRERGVFFHCDASQAMGVLPIDVDAMQIDLLSFTAHKFYGPQGVGGLWIRRKRPRVRLAPAVVGGGQEGGLRPGTLNVAGIIGLGRASELARQEMGARQKQLTARRERLAAALIKAFPEARLNGHPEFRHPGNLNLTLPGMPSRWIRGHLPHIACSSGSACASAMQEPSHVLRAIGLDLEAARQTLRFGVGVTTTEAEIDQAVAEIVAQAGRYEPGMEIP